MAMLDLTVFMMVMTMKGEGGSRVGKVDGPSWQERRKEQGRGRAEGICSTSGLYNSYFLAHYGHTDSVIAGKW